MKTILLFSILFCVLVMPAIGALDDADLDKIRLIVKDEINSEITASEERLKTYVDTKVDGLKTPITWLIGILVAVIALIGIPFVVLTIMIGWRSIKDNSQEKINQELREEIEMLKQQQIANS